MLKIYRYIYFRIYSLNNRLWGNKEMAVFNSTLAITFSSIGVVLSLQSFVEFLFNRTFPSPFDNLFISIGFVFSVLIIHYFMFDFRKKYLQIDKEFKEGKKNKKLWFFRGVLVTIYSIGPIFVYVFCIYNSDKMKL